MLKWIITFISFVGTVLNSYQKRIGFVFWLTSNIFWVGFNIYTGVYAQAALFALNSIMCIVGLVQWQKKSSSAENRKEDKMEKTKKTDANQTVTLNVKVWCQASYDATIQVPSELSLEEAVEYAKDHIDEIPLGSLEYLPCSDEIDEENTYFEEE